MQPSDRGKIMRKFFKGLLITFIVILLLGVIAVSLLFTMVNNFKYMTYTPKKLEKVYAEYHPEEIKFIAHRGLSKEAYQNTVRAFTLAAEDPDVFGIETDVWVTADGRFICMHDEDSLEGYASAREVTADVALITPLRKSAKDLETFPETDYAPALEQYLEICRNGNKTAVIEIKDRNMTEEELDGLLETVRASGAKYSFGSFYFGKLQYIRSKDADVELHLFTKMGLPRDMAEAGFTSEAKLQKLIDERVNLSCNYKYLNKKMADMFHSAGLKVGVWTVNDKKTIACLYGDYQVDYVTSDMRVNALI